MEKNATAFRTIGEVSKALGIPQHVLRYWETRFPQLRPITRAGNRRYYRPDDVQLAKRIHSLLGQQGYTVRGVQKLLADGVPAGDVPPALLAPPGATLEPPPAPQPGATALPSSGAALPIAELRAIRALLADALAGCGTPE